MTLTIDYQPETQAPPSYCHTNKAVILYQSRIMNRVARAMTKGKHLCNLQVYMDIFLQ